ncbi:MAG: hypothetical protein JO327_01135 [Nitrososphaeraceae archaeon]|nr:hypothetical protein [Nitrososphaeraceae archaeon]MBV9666711.1 hypothetical protein [Nitrososphaeraceae archaeon]
MLKIPDKFSHCLQTGENIEKYIPNGGTFYLYIIDGSSFFNKVVSGNIYVEYLP